MFVVMTMAFSNVKVISKFMINANARLNKLNTKPNGDLLILAIGQFYLKMDGPDSIIVAGFSYFKFLNPLLRPLNLDGVEIHMVK